MNNVMGVRIVQEHLYPSTCPSSKDYNVKVCWCCGAAVVAQTKTFVFAFSGFTLWDMPKIFGSTIPLHEHCL